MIEFGNLHLVKVNMISNISFLIDMISKISDLFGSLILGYLEIYNLGHRVICWIEKNKGEGSLSFMDSFDSKNHPCSLTNGYPVCFLCYASQYKFFTYNKYIYIYRQVQTYQKQKAYSNL